MSVRRLADEAVQPQAFSFTEENTAWADRVIRKYPEGRQQSAVIPLLMRAQEQDGWVTRAAIERVAAMLDMPLIRVLEVATFYTQFMLAPVGTRAHIQVCGTTPCMLRGAGELIEACKKRIHPEPLHQNADGTLSWEEVECQGACVNAPMIMIFKDSYEDLTPERFDEIVDAFEAGRGGEITPGTQIDRVTSGPFGGLTSLTDEDAISNPSWSNGPAPKEPEESDKQVPPSKSGRPDTHAPETDPAVKTPSPVKASENGEAKASVSTPPIDEKAANTSAEEVEGEERPRYSSKKGAKAALAEPASAAGEKTTRSRRAAPSTGERKKPSGKKPD